MLGNVVEEPVSAVPPPLNNADWVGENGVSFSPAVELIFQEFCPGL